MGEAPAHHIGAPNQQGLAQAGILEGKGGADDGFILTFRAVARASKFEWLGLECSVEGVLERGATGASFTRYTTKAKLRVPAGADVERAKVLLEKAERGCLVANSVTGTRHLESEITS